MTDRGHEAALTAPQSISEAAESRSRDVEGPVAAKCLEIGVVNNMPDASLLATERQFKDLIVQAAGALPVRLRFYALDGIARGEGAAQHIAAHYCDIGALGHEKLDGLIITGCEPKTASLADEVYWPGLTRVIDWAAINTRSTIFSCLAAHAAVLHLDGISRVPFGRKLSGVFDCAVVAQDPLLEGLGPELRIPHSRLNDLAAEELSAHGYRILTSSPRFGADMFVRQQESLFVFLQGHPEYDADSLLREYRRDVVRYLRGERASFPQTPEDYFDPLTGKHLAAFAERVATRQSRHPHRELANLLDDVHPAKTWRASSDGLYRNWLTYLASR
ncbi:homoserine O-succinyltransferase [Methylovirgula ligni]|uniref:Homoserine O-succinyltransferase n=1 Tax=Methylovirgula ligni TaxID=569860 RepID=A0A3D9Z217_9HYPH|nr:homoserine O-succinyltransferase [Methylovirgula ligni]QAY95749.1 homoserine O-succinyltransferase [Methylovirgula ligni]REF88875.1 homoserine O-succinyltransferase [Methylovirgula ligni]